MGYACLDRPGIDELRDRASERRIRADAADIHDHAADKISDRGEFQPHIRLIRKPSVPCGLDVGLFAPNANAVLRNRLTISGTGYFGDQLADVRTCAFDDGSEPARARVKSGDPAQVFGYRLRQRN